jgi:hypothetical protein
MEPAGTAGPPEINFCQLRPAGQEPVPVVIRDPHVCPHDDNCGTGPSRPLRDHVQSRLGMGDRRRIPGRRAAAPGAATLSTTRVRTALPPPCHDRAFAGPGGQGAAWPTLPGSPQEPTIIIR